MNRTKRFFHAVIGMITAISCTSCAVLEDPALAAAVGGGVGAIIGNEIGGGRGAAIGGLVGGTVGYAISKNYLASESQKRAALAAGRRAANKSSVKSSSTRYVAVPVKKKEGSGRDVMVYDKKNDKLANDKAYVPKSGSQYSAGKVVSVGGKSSIIATSFQGV